VESHGVEELKVNVEVLGATAGTSSISFRAVVLATGGTEVSLNVEGALAVVIVGVFALEALKAIGMNESPEHASEE